LAAEPRSGGDLARLLMEKAAGDEKILLRLIDVQRSSPLRGFPWIASDSARFGQPLPNGKGIEHCDRHSIFRDLPCLSDFDKPR